MEKTNKIKISLIIPAYNEELYIESCLNAAVKNSKGFFHEIIVIDNNSTDSTKKIAEKFPGVKVVHESRKGLTRARQKGLEIATGDFLAYIDADTLLPEFWAEKAVDHFTKNPEAVSLSGPYRYYDGSKFKNFFAHLFWWLSAPLTYRFVGYMILGGNFIAKKEALLKMGGFDKEIEFFGEDTDIARRLSQHGRVVFRMDFYMPSSSRRMIDDGLVKTFFVYGLNYGWQVFFHRPFNKNYTDPRPGLRKQKIFNAEKLAKQQAWSVTGVSLVVFLTAWISLSFNWHKAIPLLIFYLVLIFNTFFSIRAFSRIAPSTDSIQRIIDFILVTLYLAMSLNVDNAFYFFYFVMLIFIISSLKYIHQLKVSLYPEVFKKKLIIDLFGTLASALALGGIILGYDKSSIWTWVIIFVLANIILFTLWPYYRVEIKE
jgi:glycosyltransferase involved in cell wall biosynthesis